MQATFSINNTDKAEVAIVRLNELKETQTANLVNLMKREEKLDILHAKLDFMTVENKKLSVKASDR